MNPSGLCLCGCGGKTKLSDRNSTVRGWVKGQPRDYILGHTSRLESYRFLLNLGLRNRRQTLLKRRRRTQKQGPYKAGRTVKAQASARKIEQAMKGKL